MDREQEGPQTPLQEIRTMEKPYITVEVEDMLLFAGGTLFICVIWACFWARI